MQQALRRGPHTLGLRGGTSSSAWLCGSGSVTSPNIGDALIQEGTDKGCCDISTLVPLAQRFVMVSSFFNLVGRKNKPPPACVCVYGRNTSKGREGASSGERRGGLLLQAHLSERCSALEGEETLFFPLYVSLTCFKMHGQSL